MNKLLNCIVVASALSLSGCGESADDALARVNAAQEAYDRADAEYKKEQATAWKEIGDLESRATHASYIGDEKTEQSYTADAERYKAAWGKQVGELTADVEAATARLEEAKRLLKAAESR